MKILITGGLGFQGKHLSQRLLASGHDLVLLVAPDHSEEEILHSPLYGRVEILRSDILDVEKVEKVVERVDTVFHLAGKVNSRESVVDPRSYFSVNIDGTIVVLEAVKKFNKRLINVSSCAVYGDGSFLEHGETFDESSPLLPIDPYAASKVAADRLCYAYYKSYGLDITTIRPFTTYGPGQSAGLYGGLIPILVNRATTGQPLVVFGDGSAVRDFLYIDDLIDAYELLLNTQNIAGEVFNVASGHESKVADVVEYVAQLCQATIEYRPANPGEARRYAGNISKIAQLGYAPKVDLKTGIKNYLESLGV